MRNGTDPLVVFTPSGKRGRFPVGTPILTAARQLGVDLDSVCGGRGICSKCQITPAYGEFPKHGVTVAEPTRSRPGTRSRSATSPSAACSRAAASAARRRCRATSSSTCRPRVQVHKQVVRKRAEARQIVMDPATRLYYVEVAEPDMHEPSGDLRAAGARAGRPVGPRPRQGRPAHAADAAARAAQGRLEGHLRRLPRRRPRRGAHPARLARLLRGHDLRPRHRRRLHHHRRPPLRPASPARCSPRPG